MILFLFQKIRKTFAQIPKYKKIRMDHRFLAFEKLKKN